MLVACFPNLDWNPLVWVACAPMLAALLSETSLARAFFLAYLSGAIFFAGSFYWFVVVTERYGRLNPALAVGAMGLFVAVFSNFFAVFGLLEAWMAKRSRALALGLSPFLWVSIELARTYLITGFPWNLLGYAVESPGLRQVASVTAVYGLSFLAVATSALVAWLLLSPWEGWARTAVAVWIAVLTVVNLVTTPRASPPGSNLALLVQPNVPLDELLLEDWAPWRNPAPLERLVAMTVDSRVREVATSGSPPLIIWSENPAPFFFFRDPIFRGAVEQMARQIQAYVLFSTVDFATADNSQPKNSAVLLDPAGHLVVQYDKIHLVPFGEYVPWWAFPGKIGKITSEVGNFVPGSAFKVAPTPEGTIGTFICYEAIFPQLVRHLVPAGPSVLVNISNDAWYGDTPAAFQHLRMARLRAIENGRYLLRATNDGITAVVDPSGQVVEQFPRHRVGVLTSHFNYLSGRTFYTAFGDVFAWLCVMVSAVMAVLVIFKPQILN
jgi:apolipoprotein N-acyltransferase